MQKPKQFIALASVAILALLVVIAWLAGAFKAQIEPGLDARNPENAGDLFEVRQVLLPTYEYATASITPEETTIISSRILSRILELKVRAGQEVVSGEILINLEQSDLLARARQVSEQAAAIEARKIEAQTSRERAESLYEQRLIARADLDNAVANHEELVAAKAAADLAVSEAYTALSYSEIRAPISGRIVDRLAEPGDTAIPGTPLLILYNPLSLQAEAKVREKLAVKLELGQEIEIEVPSLEQTFSSTIVEIVPAANPGSRSFQIKAAFDYEDGLLPGMYARLKIPSGEDEVVVIPEELISDVGQLDVVWVFINETRQRRIVKLGDNRPEGVIVHAGLSSGEILVRPGT